MKQRMKIHEIQDFGDGTGNVVTRGPKGKLWLYPAIPLEGINVGEPWTPPEVPSPIEVVGFDLDLEEIQSEKWEGMSTALDVARETGS